MTRLIDADAFENYVFDEWENNEISNGDWMTFREWLRDQETVIEFDGDLTRVIVRGEEYFPVKHGRWVVDPEGMLHCSNCKELPTNRIVVNADLIYDMTPIKEKMKYCPRCGARMDERKES